MDRALAYTGQLLPASTILQIAKDSMVGVSKLAEAIVGTSTQIYGFPCTPTGPASMQVNVGAGVIFSLQTADATAYGDLGTDSHQILKQGILADAITPSFTAPGTAGQSVNYLIQIAFSESDTTSSVLPYYNSANPSLPYTGPGNTGTSQATRRQDLATVSVKAGTPATTGSQTTPSPDAGYVGAWVVTVANGQTTITSGNIAKYGSAPFVISPGLSSWVSYVITSAGQTPDPATANQLKSALDALYAPSTIQGSFKNLQAGSSGTSSAISVTADALVLSNGSGTYKTVTGVSLTIDLANTIGQPLAISTGTWSANTWYAIYVWNNGTSTTGTADPSGTTPTAPAGYSGGTWMRVGWIRTDSTGNKYPLAFKQIGRSVRTSVAGNVSGLPALAAGVQGNINTPTWVSVSLANYVPGTASEVLLIIAGASSGTVVVAPSAAYGAYNSTTNPPPATVSIGTVSRSVTPYSMLLESAAFYYAADISAAQVFCGGWEDNL